MKDSIENENLMRMKRCPRFERCSVPLCPLDADVAKRKKLPGEPNCTLPKSIRMRIGKDLPWGGLTKRELVGYRSWKRRSKKSKREALKNLAVGRKKLNYSSFTDSSIESGATYHDKE